MHGVLRAAAYASTLMLLLDVLEPLADVPPLSAYAFNMFKVCASSRDESVCCVESLLSLLLASSVMWLRMWPMCGRPVGAVSLVPSVALAVAESAASALLSALLSVTPVLLVAAVALAPLALLAPSVAETALLSDVDALPFSALKIAALACLAS